MSTIALVIFGAIAGSVLWIFALAWLINSRTALRKELRATQTTLRLYRMSREDQDAQLAALFAQNERLAMQLVLAKAQQPVITLDGKALARCAAGVES